MADQPSPDPSSQELETEVNDLIAEAEALSDDLSTEIGSAEKDGAREREFFETETDSETSLEQQLAAADQSLDELEQQLAEEPAESASVEPTETLAGSAEAPVETAPAKKKISLPPKGKAPATADSPADSGEPRRRQGPPKRGSPQKQRRWFDDLHRVTRGPGATRSAEGQESRTHQGRWTKRMRPIPKGVAGAAELGCSVLEAVDKPFRRIGYGARWIIGWIALVLAIAAIWLWLVVIP